VVLRLQELEFLFNPIQRFRDSELEGLACSLVRRLGVTREGDPGRMDKAESQGREKRVGQKIKLRVVVNETPNSSLRLTLEEEKVGLPLAPIF
jgi:hypothetical protein